MTEQGEGWLPRPATELFGPEAVAKEAYGLLTVDVPAAAWTVALRTARDELGCTFFDWLTAVDEPAEGFRVAAHVVAVGTPPRRLLLRTTVPHEAPALATATGVYAGAAWHERETHEMFGVDFPGHPHLVRLLLPEEFEGHPLRKDFVLAARVAKAWPGAKEPGESHAGGPKRRQMQPPGVPDPNDWGPQKGTLPPPPTRPTRRARATSAEAGSDRPARDARRTRSVSGGSASQRAAEEAPGETHDGEDAVGSPPAEDTTGDAAGDESGETSAAAGAAPGEAGGARPPRGARRTRSAGGGSASQRAADEDSASRPGGTDDGEDAGGPAPADGTTTGPAGAAPGEAGAGHPPRGARRARSASEGSASQRPAGGGPAAAGREPRSRTRTPDAPWQRPQPDDESTPPPKPAAGEGTPSAGPTAGAPAPGTPPASGGSGSPESAAGGTPSAGLTAGDPDPSPDPAAGRPEAPESAAAEDTPPARPAAGEASSAPEGGEGGDRP
ncbi:NADH-quinone oxidoreductase subunit C [Streptomyces sp. CMB-StM0423]|uniref:NADH-quinone oxidoreductase subunit C n=1 Tax=Streptomyces sp. CMB-StM0423 TaxID=2059884 RepID=UPI000C7089F6|nr:NADH-quinone oxidoreductase subunit C [Streptomyces sp. CMB-StM0423]AUH41215.1 dehydrogenase [Streptomyces sp. CMB-StM0423]